MESSNGLEFFDVPNRLPNGRFPPGFKASNYWDTVDFSGNGAKKIFETPEALEAKMKEYFNWVESRPIIVPEVGGKDARVVDVKKMHAPTKQGFCAFAGIIHNTYCTYAKRPGYKEVCSIFDSIIFSINFAGAAAGAVSHMLIARQLGLSDKKEVNHNISQKVVLFIPQIEASSQVFLEEGDEDLLDFEEIED